MSNNVVKLTAGDDGYQKLRFLLQGGDVEFQIVEGYSVPLYEVGDRIEHYGDSGPWMPAEVTSVSTEHVGIKYGPASQPNNMKFTTNMSPYSGSIRTNKRRIVPPVLNVRPAGVGGAWIILNPPE